MENNKSAFSKIKSESVVDKIIRQLVAAIKNGNLKVGDKLPPERDLALTMGVSRNTLREAVKILAFMNIVKMQHGSGTYVTSSLIDEEVTLKTSDLLTSSDHYLQALEIRSILEPPIAALAALKAEKKDLEAMDKALQEMKVRAEKKELFGRSALRFHLAIAETTKNSFAKGSLIHPLSIWYDSNPKWISLIKEKITSGNHLINAYELCLNIYDAIKEQEDEKAKAAMQERIQHIKITFFENQ